MVAGGGWVAGGSNSARLCLLCLKEEKKGPSKRKAAGRLRIKMNANPEYPDVHLEYPGISGLSG